MVYAKGNKMDFKGASYHRRLASISYVLVVDDDVDDQMLICDALSDSKLGNDKVKCVNDGEELMVALREAKTLPSFILLDLNMPKKDGRTALLEIKQDQRLRHIPVIIFSTSSTQTDIKDCYFRGSNTYITKPHSYKDLVDTMGDILQYWTTRAQIAVV